MARTDTPHHPTVIPAGFAPMPMGGPFIAANGPLYASPEGQQHARLGLPIDGRHVNSIATLHGGMLAAFADMLMSLALYRHPEVAATGRTAPTVSLQIDYIGLARLGDWLEGTADVIRATRSLVFLQGLILANDQPVARCSGVYKFGRPFASARGMYIDGTEAPCGS